MLEKRTDLALEAQEIYTQNEKTSDISGVSTEKVNSNGIIVTRVKIKDKIGSEALKKPIGSYITLEIPKFIHENNSCFDEIKRVISDELAKIYPKTKKNMVVLVVGLGNRNITADALGPKVVDGLLVTRHLFELMPEDIEDGILPVCAISPGVLGLTGIETNEIIKGVTDRIKPDLVIAIDALASRSISRVMTTIQITDTGITPGAGVGNKRGELTFDSLKVPVIAIGVPTVVDAATMANDTIDMVIESIAKNVDKGSPFYSMLKDIDSKEKYHLINEVLSETFVNLVVTPKEVDEIIDELAELISGGINASLHSGINAENSNCYN